jgi:nucleotide-binding universal stress UspA family protein
MKTKTSDNPTPRNLESGFSDDGAGTIRCLCSTCRSSVPFCSVRMSGHEKSNYAGLYARQAYQTKKDSLSQPATAARNLRYETDATIAQRFANFAAKASPAFGKFYRFSDSTPIDVSSSNEMKTSSTSRSHTQQRLIRNILVPIDFSDCSMAGLKYAVRFGKETGARIIVLHVTDLGPVMMTTGRGDYDSPAYIAAAKRQCGDQMQAFLKRVELKGVPIKTSAVVGYCPGAIYEAAAKEGADLIIISTHGRTGLRRAFIGSVAEGTVRHAACPVLVVPSFSLEGKRGSSETARQPAQRTPAKQPSARSRLSKS